MKPSVLAIQVMLLKKGQCSKLFTLCTNMLTATFLQLLCHSKRMSVSFSWKKILWRLKTVKRSVLTHLRGLKSPMLLDYAYLHCSILCQILIWIPKTFPFPSDGVMFPLLYIARSHSLLYWSSFVDLKEIHFLCYHSLSSGSHLNNLCVFTLVSPCRLLMVSDLPWLELSECLTLFDLGALSTLSVIVY